MCLISLLVVLFFVFVASDSFGSVESVKAASGVYSPVPGEVIEVNEVRNEQRSIGA